MEGNFVVKTSKGSYNALAADMKLEQSIQRSSKSFKGIIGETRSIGYTTEWCLIYHEILGIKNAFQSLTNPNNSSSETHIHHELSKSAINQFNVAVQKMKQFMNERGNPYLLEDSTKVLKNISSQVVSNPEVSNKHLKFFELSQKKFNDFHKRVYVDRSSLLSDTIHQYQLLPVDHVVDVKRADVKPVAESIKQQRLSRKIFTILAGRLQSKQEAIRYDISLYNPLFDGQTMASTSGKADMVNELEVYLKEEHYQEEISASVVIVDAMSFIRSHKISSYQYSIFEKLADFLYTTLFRQAQGKVIHIVFDSYEERSLKEATRQSRSTQSSMQMSAIHGNTPIPLQMDKFWSSSQNKESFQKYLRQHFTSLAIKNKHDIVLSGMLINGKQVSAVSVSEGQSVPIDSLISNIEEADQRLIKHIHWSSLTKKTKSFIVSSKDTDVLVILLDYFKTLQRTGVQKIWHQIGSGEKKRAVPIHNLYQRIPKPLRRVILPCYIGTGCDYLSKIGTKLGAINAFPEKYLQDFGKTELGPQQIALAEEYLVQVIKKDSNEKTFDDLRYSLYLKNLDLAGLPPTSHSVHGHIARWWFLVRKLRSLLDTTEFVLNPVNHGWIESDGHLLPEKNLKLVPETMAKCCNCKTGNRTKKCTSKKCSCKKTNQVCSPFCQCQSLCTNIG